jgi:hypothetical protein
MTAPAVVETPTMPSTIDDAMGFVLKDTLTQSLADAGETGERPRKEVAKVERNELGQFVSESGATTAIPPRQQPETPDGVTPATATPAAGDATGDATPEGEPPAVEIPEGYVAPPALPDDKARGFTVRDAEGEIVPPDLTWELTANGKPRSLSTDKLVAYAQMGVYNHEREQQTQQIQTRAQQLERAYTETQQAVELRDHQIERLLSDPEFLLRAQVAYEQQNTPEARWQRQQEQLAAERSQVQLQQAAIETTRFIDQTMTPALDLILREYPTVTQDELAAKFFLAADPYRQNGVLMPQGHDALKRWVVFNLEPEIRQLHEARSQEREAPRKEVAKVEAKAKADVQAAQVQAQKAKNQTARALKPAGKAMPDTVPKPVVKSLKDAESVIMQETMAAMRAG